MILSHPLMLVIHIIPDSYLFYNLFCYFIKGYPPQYISTQPEKPHNRVQYNDEIPYHDREDESGEEEFDNKPTKRSGLTESQEILLMLQQEEALRWVQILHILFRFY